MAADESAEVGTMFVLTDTVEAQRQCRLGFHAWVPWLTVFFPEEPNRIHHYETWCARVGCNHVEQWDQP